MPLTLQQISDRLEIEQLIKALEARGGKTIEDRNPANTDELVGKHNTGRQCLSRKARAHENEY